MAWVAEAEMAFERYIGPTGRGRRTGFSMLEVGECWIFHNKTKKEISPRVLASIKRTGRDYEYLECKNGIVMKRIK